MMENDRGKFHILPKTNEEYTSVTYGCIRFIDSCRFRSSSLDSSVKTLVDKSHKTLKDFKEESVHNDEVINIVNELKVLIKDDRYKNDSIKDLKEEYPNKTDKIEETLLNSIGENDHKILRKEPPDNRWKYLTKQISISI